MTDTNEKQNAVDPNTHWKLDVDEVGVAWLGFDQADAGTNVLSQETMTALGLRIQELSRKLPKALVIYSAKKIGFVAGADIKGFLTLTNQDEATRLVRSGQDVMTDLERLPCTTVAMINGFALGGGLELAMACDYRVVVDDDSARLGLPEVKLGLHPGFGGTVRTIKLCGPVAAMDMMLTGRGLRPKYAKKIGLVDQVVPARHLKRAAQIMAEKAKPKRSSKAKDRVLNTRPGRKSMAKMLERQVSKKARKEHYPAPFAMIKLWRDHYEGSDQSRYEAEARSFAEVMLTPTAKNLVRVFFLQDRLKALGKQSKQRFSSVHVIGAGVMGGDIAAWCALRGLNVTLQDREPKYIAPAISRATKLFEKKLKEPRLVQAAKDRLMPDMKGMGVAGADVVIEAIFENVEAKQTLYKELEPRMKADAILATNTSSIRLETLNTVLKKPGRLIGLHFFNPV
ncbi:MAG: 3-hydroxyacyl-CoA dehydrogenase NAD-binding domain-containing protein, partial [Pseudomonadota bacterium]